MQNNHLTHLEDLAFTDGLTGAWTALCMLRNIDKLTVRVKWDGAPALVFGPAPGDGHFFVATKSAFNKTPKLARTHADIDALYPGSVNRILHVALDELPALKTPIILQGDVLYTPDMLRMEADATGDMFLTFQPNTLVYGAPISNLPLVRSLTFAKLGIALHTEYPTLDTARPLSMRTWFELARTERVHVQDTHLFHDNTHSDVSGSIILGAEQAIHKLDLVQTAVFTQEPMQTCLMQYANDCVRRQRSGTVDGFALYLTARRDATVAARKTEFGKGVQHERFNALIKQADKCAELLHVHRWLTLAKNYTIVRLNMRHYNVATFFRTDVGLQRTGPEGYVLTSADSTLSLKLVNRSEFSRRNFTSPKTWQ